MADFGLTEDMYGTNYYRRNSEARNQSDEKVPIRWMAPESIERDIYNESTDVVSKMLLYLQRLLRPLITLKIRYKTNHAGVQRKLYLKCFISNAALSVQNKLLYKCRKNPLTDIIIVSLKLNVIYRVFLAKVKSWIHSVQERARDGPEWEQNKIVCTGKCVANYCRLVI